MPWLVVDKQGAEVLRYSLEKKLVRIGRSPQCDVVLSDRDVSALHANLLGDATEGYRLIDAGSTNGTTIDGTRIREWALQAGEPFLIGQYALRVEDGNVPERTAILHRSGDHLAEGQAILIDIQKTQMNLPAGPSVETLNKSLSELETRLL